MSFLGALLATFIGAIVNYLIHKSNIKQIRIENEKKLGNSNKETLLKKMPINSPEELIKILENPEFKKAIVKFHNLDNFEKVKENINAKNLKTNKKVDSNIIELTEKEESFYE